LAKKLERTGLRVTAIHGNKTQSARQKALDAFRQKRVTVLVATDVAARGIDVDGVTHVINYDMPVEPESYVHRIGRTGRAGAEGIAISFCTSDEQGELRAIEQLIGQRLTIENPEARFSAVTSSTSKQRGTRRRVSAGGSRNTTGKRGNAGQQRFHRGKKKTAGKNRKQQAATPR
jgi:ATP-dependent RNA helicase RhlE